MEDLFEKLKPAHHAKERPLAVRISPQRIQDFVGQSHILAPGRLLRRLIESDRLQSVIFYGPSGTGKTALARIIARLTKSHFLAANAVTLGVSELRRILDAAKKQWHINRTGTILLIDEIHHFNKTQQDALLPDVETGDITIIGITTENPFFYVNAALLSRSQTFEFYPLRDEDLKTILTGALHDRVNGVGNLKVQIDPDALNHIVIQAGGDARKMLNALEVGVLSTQPDSPGIIHFSLNVAEESIQKKALMYDKKGDSHYDTVSAFIKSMRGSDPDAAVYWMVKMLAAGEDPRFVIRRVIILASEDIGNADPMALVLASAALHTIEFVGLPEARIILAHAVTYAASAPKSNASYLALEKASHDIETKEIKAVPGHLKDAHLDREQRGHGQGYQYPHDFPGHFVHQEYLPGKKKGRLYYWPTDEGYEKKIRERLEKLDKIIQEEKSK